jgi:WD40 repeat protein
MLAPSLVYGLLLLCANGSRSDHSVWKVEAISVRPQQPNQQQHTGIGGTTSVQFLSETSSLLVGTKKGGIYFSIVEQEKNQDPNDDNSILVTRNEPYTSEHADENSLDGWSELKSNDYKTKYPIYSLAAMSRNSMDSTWILPSSYDDIFLFCGSGDRWISVWKLESEQDGDCIPNPDFKFMQTLGPHTGWVKDLVYDDRSRLLHSIGCNCIETWDCSSMYEVDDGRASKNQISHATKRTIENSPTAGTTLSSDLLCLCLLPSIAKDGDDVPPLLVSGGVDGRIHLWLSDHSAQRTCRTAMNLDGQMPLHTILAHDGRVNAIVFSTATKSIFTAGNDGFLCVFRASVDKGFELVSKLKIDNGTDECFERITTATITRDLKEQMRCSLALGSSTGDLCFVAAETNSEGGTDSRIEGNFFTVAENSMIYSIASEKGSDPSVNPRLWVGHASGLATVDSYGQI